MTKTLKAKAEESLKDAMRELYQYHSEMMKADGHDVHNEEDAFHVADNMDYDEYMNQAYSVGYIRALKEILR